MNITHGINPDTVDTSAKFTLGMEVDDPRQSFPGNKIRYVKAGSTIALGDALKIKADEADEPWVLIPTSAVRQVVVGIAHVAIASGSYGWVTVKGRVPSAKITTTGSAEDRLGSSGTAGALVVLAQADTNFSSNNINAVIAAAAGIGLMAMDSWDSNNSTVEVLIS